MGTDGHLVGAGQWQVSVAGLYLSNGLKQQAARRALVRRVLWRLEAGLLGLIWGLSRLLGPDRASALAAWAMSRLGPRLRHHPKLMRNLRSAFPDWTPEKVEAVAVAAWGQVGRVIAEYPHLDRILRADRLDLVSSFDLGPIRSGERPAIFVGAHLANWELAAGAALMQGVPLTAIYSPQRNEVIREMTQKRRAALGCRFLPKRTNVHGLLAEIKAGQSLGVLMDQRYDEGDTVRFFGRPAPVALAPAMLAAKLGLPLVPIRVERLEGCRFRATLLPPIEPDKSLGDTRAVARAMTEQVYRHFETWIRDRPEQWLCIKHRWPNLKKPKWQEKLARNPRLAAAAEEDKKAAKIAKKAVAMAPTIGMDGVGTRG